MDNLTIKIKNLLARNKSVVLVGPSDSGKTYWLKNVFIPQIKSVGMRAKYLENSGAPYKKSSGIVICDEVETLFDERYLQRGHKKPYYEAKYLEKVGKWFKRYSTLPPSTLFVITRNTKDQVKNLMSNFHRADWDNRQITILEFKPIPRKTPRVIFKDFPISREVELLYGFLFQSDWGWGKYVLSGHPGLKPVLALKSRGERKKFIEQYVISFKRKNKRLIKSQTAIYKKAWTKVEGPAFSNLSKIIGSSWENRAITAYVSINPICPRFLNEQSFSLFYNYSPERAKEIILHESCHFLYFKKWKEAFPSANPKTFDAPYLEWHLSEIIAPIILNDPRINKYIGQRARFYTEHAGMKIGRTGIPAYFTQLYDRIVPRRNFEEFLREAYVVAKKHKVSFSKK